MNDETQASLARLFDVLGVLAMLGCVWAAIEIVWSLMDLWRAR